MGLPGELHHSRGRQPRLRGMLKNRCKVHVLAALSNLFMARYELLCRA